MMFFLLASVDLFGASYKLFAIVGCRRNKLVEEEDLSREVASLVFRGCLCLKILIGPVSLRSK